MAKHKKNGRGRRKRRCQPGCNHHHIFFVERVWLSSGKWAAMLRKCQWCIVEVPVVFHMKITEKAPPVPVPDDETIERVLFQLDRLVKHGSVNRETSLERRLEILVYLFDGAAPATAKALREQLEIAQEYRGLLS